MDDKYWLDILPQWWITPSGGGGGEGEGKLGDLEGKLEYLGEGSWST